MGTTSAQIDIIEINEVKGIYEVSYWDENCENENNATIQISEDSLLDFVVSEELNREDFINYNMRNLECDGLDERFINPSDYLENNLKSTIKEYIQFNS